MQSTAIDYLQYHPGDNLPTGSPWRVCEERDEYGKGLPELLALADLIEDKLTKAEALSWLLHGTADTPEAVSSVTAQVIAEFIGEALEAHERQWESIRMNYRQK